jgi:hypothetical protein
MLIGGSFRHNVSSPRVWWYKQNKAWLDTPLHLCSWLSIRRQEKAKRTYANKEKRRQIDNEIKRNRWKTDPLFRAMRIEKRRLHRQANKDRHNAWHRDYLKKRRQDQGIRLKANARSRFWKVMQSVKALRNTDSFNDLIGCSSSFLRQHIEIQFEPWMNWDNYGPGWQMDHKIPLKFFDLFDPEQAKSAFHFSNLKPVSTAYNASKQARWADV